MLTNSLLVHCSSIVRYGYIPLKRSECCYGIDTVCNRPLASSQPLTLTYPIPHVSFASIPFLFAAFCFSSFFLLSFVFFPLFFVRKFTGVHWCVCECMWATMLKVWAATPPDAPFRGTNNTATCLCTVGVCVAVCVCLLAKFLATFIFWLLFNCVCVVVFIVVVVSCLTSELLSLSSLKLRCCCC